MTSKKMWFGNDNKMQWVNCPAVNIQRNRVRWSEEGNFMNGGAFLAQSPYSHLEYSINWNLMDPSEVSKIMSYFDGTQGQGLIRMLDPFAMKSNILPLHWSVPVLCVGDGAPTLGVAGAAVTASGTATSTIPNVPYTGALFTVNPIATGVSHTVHVPPGYNLYFGYSANLACVQINGTSVNPSTSVMYTNVFTNPGNCVIKVGTFTGGPAARSIRRMSAVVAKEMPTHTDFIQGEGHTGLRFSGTPGRTGYSSVLNLESLTANFKEVGAWE